MIYYCNRQMKNPRKILNDDCLNEVFTRIHPSNYHLIADVCVQFNRAITEMFTRKYKRNMFDITDMQSFTLPEADLYLRYFGSFIYRVKVNGYKLKNENFFKIEIFLKMISEHCVNLHCFHIIDFGLKKAAVNEITPLFIRLTDLWIKKIGDDYAPNGPVFLPSINCPKLIKLIWEDESFQG